MNYKKIKSLKRIERLVLFPFGMLQVKIKKNKKLYKRKKNWNTSD